MTVRTVLVLPYPNPHFLGLIDALCSDDRFQVSVLYLANEGKFRKNFKLGSLGNQPVIRLFSHDGISRLWHSDAAIVHGLFYWHVFLVAFLLCNKRVFFTSEPINPFSRTRYKDLLKKLIISFYKVVFKEMIILACGGEFLKRQLLDLGLTCRYYQFGLFPRVVANDKMTCLSGEMPVGFAFVGQFIPRKNVDLLVQAIKVLNSDESYRHRFTFSFIGDGEQSGDIISFSEGKKNVFYLGVMTSQQVRDFLKYNHVLVLPSFFDGWGAVVNEAVFNSNAILVTRSVYASTLYLKEGTNGFYIHETFVLDLVDKMKRYIEDRRILNLHRQASLEIAKTVNANCFLDDLYHLAIGSNETKALSPL